MTAIDPRAYRRWAYAVARDFLAQARRTDVDLDDLAQEALVAIWQAAEKHDPAKGALPSYVTTAARMRLRDLVFRDRPVLGAGDRTRTHGSRDGHVQVESLDARLAALDAHGDPTPPALVAEAVDPAERYVVDTVRAAVAELPERERLAVAAVDLLGMTPAEAAPVVGVVVGHVRNLRRRAYGRLRVTLAPLAA